MTSQKHRNLPFPYSLMKAVRPPRRMEMVGWSLRQKEHAVQNRERRIAFIADHNMFDVRIERRSGGSTRRLVDYRVTRSRTVITLPRHTGKGDDAPIGRSQ